MSELEIIGADFNQASPIIEIPLKNIEFNNCLALTVKQDYKLVVVKNSFRKICTMSWKVIASIVTLNFLKLFL